MGASAHVCAKARPPRQETQSQRNQRERESRIWEQSVHRIGPVPAGSQWISVGDRGSDIFPFWQAGRPLGYDFPIRVAQDRGVVGAEGERSDDPSLLHLKTRARQLPAQDIRLLHLPSCHGRPARDAVVVVRFEAVRIQPPFTTPPLRRRNCRCGWCASGSRCLLLVSSHSNGSS